MSLDSSFNITLDSNDASFKILGDEKLRITSLGNVGIGTTAPGAKLHILGDGPVTFARSSSVHSSIKSVAGAKIIINNRTLQEERVLVRMKPKVMVK